MTHQNILPFCTRVQNVLCFFHEFHHSFILEGKETGNDLPRLWQHDFFLHVGFVCR